MNEWFRRFAKTSGRALGSPHAFFLAALVIVVWVASGPFFDYSEAWQLIINTSTTIVTFLMVFLIQNSQNREATATQIKLDELIRALDAARNALIKIEDKADDEMEVLQEEFRHIGTDGSLPASPAVVPTPLLPKKPS